MKKIETPLKDLWLIEPDVYKDERGYFFESYHEKKYKELGIRVPFVQDNQSCSVYGVIRGLHYQLQPYAQTKLIRVIRGSIYDVAVDLRKRSATFGQWYGVELSDKNFLQLYIPQGFAHGFSVLSPEAEVLYKCDTYWNKNAERGIVYNDAFLAIDWKIPAGKELLSVKDRNLPTFNRAEYNFD